LYELQYWLIWDAHNTSVYESFFGSSQKCECYMLIKPWYYHIDPLNVILSNISHLVYITQNQGCKIIKGRM
jgi:hypothetical protein